MLGCGGAIHSFIHSLFYSTNTDVGCTQCPGAENRMIVWWESAIINTQTSTSNDYGYGTGKDINGIL